MARQVSQHLPAVLQHRWVQALLILAAALYVHQQLRLWSYNRGPLPDAWQRQPNEHRG